MSESLAGPGRGLEPRVIACRLTLKEQLHGMSELIDTTEMYLRTVLELQEEGIPPMRARIAERLGHSGPTVSQTVARMERDGLLLLDEHRHLTFTPLGRERAISVMRKHRLAERLLADVIGLDWEFVHEEACRWEHVMSDRVEERIAEILDDPSVSPYGIRIPEASDQGEPHISGVNLEKVVTEGGPYKGTVLALAETLQVDPILLGQLRDGGIKPQASITAEAKDDYIVVRVDGVEGALELPPEVSAHIFVAQ